MQKAPSAMELFVAGDHLVVQRYELGNPNMAAERANNIDLNFETAFAGFDAKLNLFRNNISNYIYAEETDDVATIQARLEALGKDFDKDGGNNLDLEALTELEVALFTQQDAIFKGYEIELSRSFVVENGTLDITFGRDYVDAQFKDGGYVPRIAPVRNIINFAHKSDNGMDVVFSVKNVQEQSKVANHEEGHDHGETTTGGFTWIDFNLSRKIKTSDSESLTVSLFAKNLLNVVAKDHTSFVKDEVPMPGRNVGLKVNYGF